jgi:hypothetical protein
VKFAKFFTKVVVAVNNFSVVPLFQTNLSSPGANKNIGDRRPTSVTMLVVEANDCLYAQGSDCRCGIALWLSGTVCLTVLSARQRRRGGMTPFIIG